MMTKLKITQCPGEGQGSCKRCSDNGKWNRNWMCFLYKIEGREGCYCEDCIKKLKAGSFDSTNQCREIVVNYDKYSQGRSNRK